MFTHVMLGAQDLEASRRFYDAVLGALGLPAGAADPRGRVFWRTPRGMFGITRPIDGAAATHANGGTVGFFAGSAEAVDAFHAAGLASGGSICEGPPGPRPSPVSGSELYIAYLRDPTGNKICAVHPPAPPQRSPA